MREEFDVSVIVPSYNSARFIEPCLTSALEQRDIRAEILVVDDAGTDATRDIIRGLMPTARHPLRLFERPGPMGQATARNVGLDAARGRYVHFLDSDDSYLDDLVLARWHARAERDQLELVRGNFERLNVQTGATSQGNFIVNDEEVVVDVASRPDLVNVNTCWQFLYRREFLDRIGLRFSMNLRQREDRLFFVQALVQAGRVGFTAATTVRHRIHPASSMHQLNPNQLAQFCTHIEELAAFFNKKEAKWEKFKEFYLSNIVFYYFTATNYWKRDFLNCIVSDDTGKRQLAERYVRALAALDDWDGVVADITALQLDGRRERLVREGVIDALRMCARHGRFELFADLVRDRCVRFHEIRERVRFVDDLDERVFATYCSFQRGVREAVAGAAAPHRRVLLHAGLPKTGSSALQNFLELNRFRLLDAGFYYPLTGIERPKNRHRRHRTAGHARLFEQILAGKTELLGELRAEIAQNTGPDDTIILSCENLLSPRFWEGWATLERVRAALDFADVTFVAVLRHHADWIESYYAEMIAHPANGVIAEPAAFLEECQTFDFLDFAALGARAVEVFGRDRVHLLGFEELRRAGGIAAAFARRFDFEIAHALEVPKRLANESLPPEHAELVRQLKVRDADPEAVWSLLPKLVDRIETRADACLITPAARRAFAERFAESRAACERDHLEQPLREIGHRTVRVAAADLWIPVTELSALFDRCTTKKAWPLRLAGKAYRKAKRVVTILGKPVKLVRLVTQRHA